MRKTKIFLGSKIFLKGLFVALPFMCFPLTIESLYHIFNGYHPLAVTDPFITGRMELMHFSPLMLLAEVLTIVTGVLFYYTQWEWIRK